MFLQDDTPLLPDSSPFHLLNFLLLIIYILAQGVLFLVKRKKVGSNPIHALQIDLEKVEAKVVNLDMELDRQNIQINNKLDILLSGFDEHRTEFKESQKAMLTLNERVIRIEEQLKRRR